MRERAMNRTQTYTISRRTRIIVRMISWTAAFCLLLTYAVANY